MRRHASWVVLALLVPLTFALFAALTMAFGRAAVADTTDVRALLVILQMICAVSALAVPLTFLVYAILSARRARRRALRAKGRYILGDIHRDDDERRERRRRR